MPFRVGNEYGFGQRLLNTHLVWLLFSQIFVTDFSFGLLWLLGKFLLPGAELLRMGKSFPALQFLILSSSALAQLSLPTAGHLYQDICSAPKVSGTQGHEGDSLSLYSNGNGPCPALGPLEIRS